MIKIKRSITPNFSDLDTPLVQPYHTGFRGLEWELTQTGAIVNCSPTCSQILDYTQNELMEISRRNGLLDLIHANDRKKYQAKLQETKAAVPSFNLLRIKHKKGIWVHLAYDTKISAQTKNVHLTASDVTYLLQDISFVFNDVRNLIQQLLAVTNACLTEFDEKACMGWMTIGDMAISHLTALIKAPIHSYQMSCSDNTTTLPKITSTVKETKLEKVSQSSHIAVATETKATVCDVGNQYQDSSDIHVEVDMKGKILSVNPSLRNVLGYSEQELKALVAKGIEEIYQLIYERDRALVVRDIKLHPLGAPYFTVARVKHHDHDKGFICLGLYIRPNLTRGIIHIAAQDLSPYLTDVYELFHEAKNMTLLIAAAFAKMTEVLKSEKNDQTKQTAVIEAAKHGELYIWHLLRILQRQTIAEFLANKPVATDLVESIEIMADLLRVEAAKKKLTIETVLPKESLYFIDRVRLEEVLINIMVNVIGHTSIGRIKILLNIVKQQNNAHDQLQFVVSDTGVGISEEVFSNIFVSYDSKAEDKDLDKQVGLGLPIVRHMVNEMGGSIHCESKMNQGTTITLVVPAKAVTSSELKKQQESDAIHLMQASDSPRIPFLLSTEQVSSPIICSRFWLSDNQEKRSVQKKVLKDLKILIVDDCEINTKIYEKMLSKMGCQCTRVFSGKLAFAALFEVMARDIKKFDIIFMDISMPDLDGIATTQYIRKAQLAPGAIIIGLSGNSEPEDIKKAQDAGMVDYVIKPATDKKLEAVIKRNLHRLSNQESNTQRSWSGNLRTRRLLTNTSRNAKSSSGTNSVLLSSHTSMNVSSSSSNSTTSLTIGTMGNLLCNSMSASGVISRANLSIPSQQSLGSAMSTDSILVTSLSSNNKNNDN